MKRGLLNYLLLASLLFSTGAGIIDNETRDNVRRLDQKIDRLLQQQGPSQGQKGNGDILQVLREQGQILRRLSNEVSKMSDQTAIMASVPAEPPKPEPVKPEPSQEALKTVHVTLPYDLRFYIKNASDYSLFSLIVSTAGFLAMLFGLVSLRRGQMSMQRFLRQSELDQVLKEEPRRPQLKILSGTGKITLENVGNTSADDIKLYLGSGLATMKQKLKTPLKIRAGEKTEIDLNAAQPSAESLYATVEYKNNQNGRIYKDQFVLKNGSSFPQPPPPLQIQKAC